MQSSERCISVPFSPSVLRAFARIVYVVVLAKADAALAQDASPAPFAPSWDATPEQHFEPAALPENGPLPGMATPIESDEDRAFALRLARQMAGRFSLDFNLGTVVVGHQDPRKSDRRVVAKGCLPAKFAMAVKPG